MKKIGIFAIGAMLFVSVACNKDSTQLEPSTNYTNSELQSPPKDPNGGLTPAPNNENLGDNGSATRIKPKVRPDGVRNDEVNPINETQRKPVKGLRNDEINPYNGTQKVIKPSGTRNDEPNTNTSNL